MILKRYVYFFYLTFLFVFLNSCLNSQFEVKDYTKYVNPFIGGAATGHTFPGACRPFGLIQAGLETGAIGWEYCSGYNYGDSLIWGFSQTHLNGTGCLDLGDILVQPMVGSRVKADYRSGFDKKTEMATPGYYAVKLTDGDILAEMTATDHVAYYRYTFNEVDTASLLIDLQHGMAWNEDSYHSHVISCTLNQEDDYTFSGETRRSVWVDRQFAFVIHFDHPVSQCIDLPLQAGEKGPRKVVSFDIKNGEKLQVQIAISSTGIDGAKNNMEEELPSWNFENVCLDAKKIWNQYLRKIEIKGTEEQLENYYTAFYHTLVQPNNIADVDGRYRGVNDQIATSPNGSYYSTFSLWDTYRAAHPLYTILFTEHISSMVNSMIAHSKVQGFLPIWTLWGKENYCMIANHGVPVVVDACLKGVKGIDLEEAYQAVKKTLTTSHRNSDWTIYDKYGYYPADTIKVESVSRTLESCFDDYAAFLLASYLGKADDALFFEKRSGYYKNLFDTTTQFMRPRLSDGSWKTPFNPSALGHAESTGGDYTEGNAWQYTWHVQHDPNGLIRLFPSREAFLHKLDSLFIVDASLLGKGLADVTGLIGQYAHGNEPSHHVAYLYSFAGRPDKTQELIHKIFETQYKNKPDGLCGNDDCGQMSAWYMFSAMGFYPLNPVSGEYIIGAPQIPYATIHLPNGKDFFIQVEGYDPNNKYVEFVMLNNEVLDRNYITHKEIMEGGTLQFMMTDSPMIVK